MKKLITISFALILSVVAWSQQCALQYTFSPASFTAEDQFTLTIDVTGTPVAGQTELYLWSWSNAGDAFFNTAWDNSPEDARLTHVSGNIFTITGSGVVWYQKSPGQLTQLQFLVKTKNGSAQTCDISPVKFDPIEFIPSKMRVFPAKVAYNDVVSVYFHQNLATSLNEQRMTPLKVEIVVYDESNNELTPASLEINLKKESTTMWRASFKPNVSFSGATPAKFKYRFKGTIINSDNEEEEVLTEFEEIVFSKLK